MRVFIVIFLILSNLYCVPAMQGEITFVQNDGTSFRGELKGDEYFSWIKLPNNYVGVFNSETKLYEYGIIETLNGVVELKASGVKLNSSNNNAPNQTPSFQKIKPISKDILGAIWKRKRKEIQNNN